jgi:hypothetical protein
VQALIGLVGVVVGALLSALLGYTQERRREHTQTRSGVRLLAADLEDARADIRRIGSPSAGGVGTKALVQLKELWLGRRDPLADGLERVEWDRISFRLRLVEAPSEEASPEQFEAQLKTIDAALDTVRVVLARLERRWRSRFRLPPLRAAAAPKGLAAATLADLVWARFLWKQELDPEASRRYQLALAEFEAAHGRIVQAYWTQRFAGGVALTEQLNRGLRQLLRGRRSLSYHRVADFAVREAPALAELLYHYETLAIRFSTLRGTPRDIGLQLIFAGSSRVLAFAETRGDSSEEIDRFNASEQEELAEIERYYSSAGVRGAQILYVRGIAAGGGGVAAILVPLSLEFASPAATPIAAVLAGAGGAVASVLRSTAAGRGVGDFEIGPGVIFGLGVTRAVIGATVGAVVFVVAEVLFGHPNPFVLASVALVAAFVVLSAVQVTLASTSGR